MMLSTGSSSSSNSSRYHPFTPTQWQELEHQALIYKYMASGIPVPPDLLLPIRRSFLFNAAAAPGIPPYYSQPGMGWSCFQMGYGRKAEDPEPGRCRRTDGKKWRCSKEAFPDSKYCERHMHRGKNRSRKPVEISLNNNNNNTSSSSSTSATTTYSSSSLNPPSIPLSISAPDSSYYPYHLHQYPLHHPYSTSSDNRFCHGMKDVDEYSFLSETSAGGRGSPWELKPLGLGEPKQSTVCSKGEEDELERRKKHCFVLGADFKLGKTDKEEEEESQRPLRHFIDEWPQKSGRESWMGLEGESSKTQLSISIPMGLHDFPQ